ncbi:MAG: hypothetical protein KTR26_20715 [Flammeovirgaceae bacterium]|nr:hypothetical protein [Flammeovirgaceae bacterium]
MSRKIVKYFATKFQENPNNSFPIFKSLISALSSYYSVVFVEDSQDDSTVKIFHQTGLIIGSFHIASTTLSESSIDTVAENYSTFFTDGFLLNQNGEIIISGLYNEEALFFKALKQFFKFESSQLIRVKVQKAYLVKNIGKFKPELINKIEERVRNERDFRNKRNELVNKLRKLLHPKIEPKFIHEIITQFLILSGFIDQLNFSKKRLEQDHIFRALQALTEPVKKTFLDNSSLWESIQNYFNDIAKIINGLEDKPYQSKFLLNFANEFYNLFYQEKTQKRSAEIPKEISGFCKKLLKEFRLNDKDKNLQTLNLSPREINTNMLFESGDNFSQFEKKLIPYLLYLLFEKNKIDFLNPLSISRTATTGLQTDLFGVSRNELGSTQIGNQDVDIITFSAISSSSPENEFLSFEYSQRDKKGVDDKITETYFSSSPAPSNALFEPGLKYLRWATDYIKDDGIILAILPSKYFIEKKYDGLRISLENEFSKINMISLGKVNFQENPNLEPIWKNSTICLLKKSKKHKGNSEIKFHQLPGCNSNYEKSTLIQSLTYESIDFKLIKPEKGNWFSQEYFDFIPLVEEASAPGKSIFKTFSKGIFPQNSQYMVKFHQENLQEKFKLLKPSSEAPKKHFATRTGYYKPFVKRKMVYSKVLEKELQQFPAFFPFQKNVSNQLICTSGPGCEKPFQVLATDSITTYDFLEKTLCFPLFFINQKGKSEENITDWCLRQFKEFYIPIIKNRIKEAKNKSDFLQEMLQKISPLSKNLPVLHKFTLKIASLSKSKEQKLIAPALANEIVFVIQNFEKKLQLLGKDAKERKKMIETLKKNLSVTKSELLKIGKSVEELEQKKAMLSKENIFYYTYAILLDPDYQKQFQENLKNNVPRIPLKPDFWKYCENGKLLVELHLGLQEIPGYPISKNEQILENAANNKPELKVNKALGSISVDGSLELGNIPPKVWQFKMGNHSILEILVKNYKKKAIRKNTNWKELYQYDFNVLKEDFINDISRLSALSIETQKILKNMEIS